MGALSQAFNIIFEMQWKMSNEICFINNKEKKSLFNLQNVFFFPFLLFGPLLILNLVTFLFLIHLKRFKVL
jgi:hypothetical protein